MSALHPRGFRTPRCAACALTSELCVCALWEPLDSGVEISVVMPASEARSTSNSARLLSLWLPRASSLYVRGEPPGQRASTSPALRAPLAPTRPNTACSPPSSTRLDDPAVLLARPHSALLFPSPDLSPPPAVVRHLIVPDGTWSQARRIERRWFASSTVPRWSLSVPWSSRYALRRHPAGLCTFEAIAAALGLCASRELSQQLLERFAEWAARARRLKRGA